MKNRMSNDRNKKMIKTVVGNVHNFDRWGKRDDKSRFDLPRIFLAAGALLNVAGLHSHVAHRAQRSRALSVAGVYSQIA